MKQAGMKYGTNPTAVDAVAKEALLAIQSLAQLHWMAWVDGAFDVADGREPASRPAGWHAYGGDGFDDMKTLSPFIAPLYTPGESMDVVRPRLEAWLQHASGRPMLSLWASEEAAPALLKHVRAWRTASTSDEACVLLRWADTRSACSLQAALAPEQWAGLTRPLKAWLYIDRLGRLQRLPMPGVDKLAVASSPPIQLTDAQVQAMAARAEPDSLLHDLCQQQPELVPGDALPSTMHGYVAWVLACAERYGVVLLPDKFSLLMAVCASRGAVIEDARLGRIFEYRHYEPGRLHENLLAAGLLA